MGVQSKLTLVRWVDEEQLPSLMPFVRQKQDACIKKANVSPILSFTGDKKTAEDGRIYIGMKLTTRFTQLKDWSLVSVYDPSKEKIVYVEPRMENELGKTLIQKNNNTVCDACFKGHNALFVLLVNGGELKNIALSCIDDELKQNVKKSITKFIEEFSFFLDDDAWEKWKQVNPLVSKKRTTIPLRIYLAGAIYFTKNEGFIRSDAQNSTKDSIVDAYHNGELEKILTENLLKESDTLSEFYKTIKSDSNYVKGLQNVMFSEKISLDDNFALGIVASAPSSYYKAVGQVTVLNAPFAEKKQRGKLKLRVNGAEPIEDIENPVIKYRLSDDEGRKFIWRATWPGKEEMKPGVYVYLTGTIKSHSLFQGIHYTMLSRCNDVEVVSKDADKPDFFESANKRAYKEEYLVSLLTEWDKHLFDAPMLRIYRAWKENNKINKFELFVPVEESVNLVESVYSKMVLDFGIKQPIEKWMKSKKNALFVNELNNVKDALSFSEFQLSERFYVVDSALGPRYSPREFNSTQRRLAKSDGPLAIARVFTSLSKAERHGRRLKHGRLSTYISAFPSILALPYSLSLARKEEQSAFFERFSGGRYDLIAYMDVDFTVKKVEPFELRGSSTATLDSVIKIHEPLRRPEKIQNSRVLQGVDIVVLTSEFGKEHCIRAVTDYAKSVSPEGYCFMDCEKELTKPFSLDEILSSDRLGRARSEALVVSSTKEAVYYLKLYGANVYHFHIGENDKEPGTVFIPSIYTEDIKEFGRAFVERLGVMREKAG